METKGYVLLISGYRGFSNYGVFRTYMNDVVSQIGQPTLVLQGECKTGVDQLAKRWCVENDYACEGFQAQWSKGRRAGPERNSVMLSNCDVICAFPHEKSRGTLDVIKKAKKTSKSLYVLDVTHFM